jgi:pyruvate dehydrogenase E2 component (dihydrolipoamide acetyltransferase)
VSIEIKLPDLGAEVDEADVLEVLISEGDEIDVDQSLLEIESDKSTTTVPSTSKGKVAKIHVSAGDSISAGDVLVTLDGEDEGTESKKKGSDTANKKSSRQESDEKQDSDGKEKASKKSAGKQKKKKSTKKESRSSKKFDAQSDDAQQDSSEDEQGESKSGEGSERQSGTKRKSDGDDNGKRKKAAENNIESGEEPSERDIRSEHETEVDDGAEIPASPAVRRFAREVGVDLHDVDGSGPGGRISREDVRANLSPHRTLSESDTDKKSSVADGVAESDAFGDVRVERLNKLRQTAAKRMEDAWKIPRVTNFDDADITELESLRQHSKSDYEKIGISLSILPLLAKAVAIALKQHPYLNAILDMENGEVHFKEYVNLGIAIDTERGLIVPNVRQADLLTISQLAVQIEELAEKARSNKIRRDDLYGTTFTISNLGSIGGTYSTAMINPPEVAILLIGRARWMNVADPSSGQQSRLMLPLSLSYDHRLVDGATAARFLHELKSYLKSPTRLLMGP